MDAAWVGFLASVLGSLIGLVGVIVTNSRANEKMLMTMQTSQAVTDEKIENLTREVREHNNFAKRVPVLEEQVKGLDRRLSGLENDGK